MHTCLRFLVGRTKRWNSTRKYTSASHERACNEQCNNENRPTFCVCWLRPEIAKPLCMLCPGSQRCSYGGLCIHVPACAFMTPILMGSSQRPVFGTERSVECFLLGSVSVCGLVGSKGLRLWGGWARSDLGAQVSASRGNRSNISETTKKKRARSLR